MVVLSSSAARKVACDAYVLSGNYLRYTDDYDWSYLTTRHEQASYSGGVWSFTSFSYLNTSDSNSHYHEEGWNSTFSSYVSDSASHYYNLYTEEGSGTAEASTKS